MNFRGPYAILALTVALILIMPSLLSHAQADSGTIQVNEQSKITLSGLGSSSPVGNNLTYLWQQTAGDPVTLDSTTNPTITFTTPAVPAGQLKMLTFQLTVDDGHGGTDHTTLNVLVQHVHHLPILVMSKDITVMEGDPVTISGSATSPDNIPLAYSWGQFSGSLASFSSNTSPTLSFTAPIVSPKASDNLLFLLEATDSLGGKARGQVEVTVLSKSSQPTTLSCTDITARQGDQVTLAPIITNPGNTALPTYFFSQISGPPVVLSYATSPNPSFTVPTPVATKSTPQYLAGQLQFVLMAHDGVTYLPQCWLNVNIAQPLAQAAAPPVANAGPDKTVEHTELVTLDGTASTGDNLQYSWTQTSGDPVKLIAPNTAQPTFVAPDVSIGQTKTLTFQLTVSNENGQNSASVTITVENPNQPPTAKITVQ
ncbi:MAG: PKD domain-containing protein [Nitrosotalea sp.]